MLGPNLRDTLESYIGVLWDILFIMTDTNNLDVTYELLK